MSELSINLVELFLELLESLTQEANVCLKALDFEVSSTLELLVSLLHQLKALCHSHCTVL